MLLNRIDRTLTREESVDRETYKFAKEFRLVECLPVMAVLIMLRKRKGLVKPSSHQPKLQPKTCPTFNVCKPPQQKDIQLPSGQLIMPQVRQQMMIRYRPLWLG
jgi:hypothetical protein